MKLTLTNDFHNTSITLNVKDVRSHIHNVATAYPTKGQIKKAKRELCGIKGCTCSAGDGTRGRQEAPSGKRLVVDLSALFRGMVK